MIVVEGKYIVDGYEGMRQSDAKKNVKAGWARMAAEWHKKYRRVHFTQRAYTKYNYTPRSKRYNRLKKKHLGHTLPLVRTGTSRNLSESKTVFATHRGSRVTMPIRIFNRRPKNSAVNMRDEFTRVINDEQNDLEQIAVRQIERDTQSFKTKIEEDF